MLRPRVGALRPYSPRIRERVYRGLESAGAEVVTLVEAGADDDQAIATLACSHVHGPLIPFHAHRTAAGDRLDGVTLIRRIRCELPSFAQTPVLCPISSTGLAAAGLMASEDDPELRDVHLVSEDEIKGPAFADILDRFVRAVGRAGVGS